MEVPAVDAESHNEEDEQTPPHGRYLSVWDRVVHQTPKCTWEGTDGGLVRRRCEKSNVYPSSFFACIALMMVALARAPKVVSALT